MTRNASKNELRVKWLLNQFNNKSFEIPDNDFEHYDIYTTRPTDDNIYSIVEVKSRKKEYANRDSWIIEELKINRMLEQRKIAESNGNILNCYLCFSDSRSLKAQQYLIDLDHVLRFGWKQKILAPKSTYGDNTMIYKDFYEFPSDIWMIELTTKQLNPKAFNDESKKALGDSSQEN